MGYNYYGNWVTAQRVTPTGHQIVSTTSLPLTVVGITVFFFKSDGSLWAMATISTANSAMAQRSTQTDRRNVSNDVVAIASAGAQSFSQIRSRLWRLGSGCQRPVGDGSTDSTNRPEQIVSAASLRWPGGSGHSLFVNPMAAFGRWVTTLMANWATAQWMTQCAEQIVSNGVVKVQRGTGIVFFLNPTAVSGRWDIMATVNWAMDFH